MIIILLLILINNKRDIFMKVKTINRVNYGATLKAVTPKKMVNRNLLKASSSNLKPLAGPEEVEKAKAIVASATTANAITSALTAQLPGELIILKAVETSMVAGILNGIYDYKLSSSVLKGIGASLLASSAGQELFRLSSKAFTWIPLLGNTLNAVISGSVTAALGTLIIEAAEAADKARRQGKEQAEIIKELRDFIEKMK